MDKKGDKVPIEVEKERRAKSTKPGIKRPPAGPPTGTTRTPRTTRTVTKWVDSEERQPNVIIIPRKEGLDKPTMFDDPDNVEEAYS